MDASRVTKAKLLIVHAKPSSYISMLFWRFDCTHFNVFVSRQEETHRS